MACVICFSSVNVNTYAAEVGNQILLEEGSSEPANEEEQGQNETETAASTEEVLEDTTEETTEEEESTEGVKEDEIADGTEEDTSTDNPEGDSSAQDSENGESVEDTDKDNAIEDSGQNETEEDASAEENETDTSMEEEETTVSDNEPEITVSGNEIQDAESSMKTEDIPAIKEYDDILGLEAILVNPDEIEGEIHDADELIEMAENMPSFMSESYGAYWDNYTSYYIYNQLSEDGQKLWSALEIMCSGYLEDETNFTNGLTDYVDMELSTPLSKDEFLNMVWMFKYSHPQYYYLLNSISYYVGSDYAMVAFGVYDEFLEGTARKEATDNIKAKLDEWSAAISSVSTEEEKILTIHNLICDKVDYNYDVLNGDYTVTPEEEQIYFTQSAYSVFCTDLTVCAGYTQAFTWLCNMADIETFGVTSYNHAWNKVKVNDNWYNVDCTWDDLTGTGNRYYTYYLRNDSYYDNDASQADSHQEEEHWEEYLPDCTLDSGSGYYAAGTLPEVTAKAAAPVISVEKSETTSTVTMSTSTLGAKIYYTLDGKTPSEANSRSYLYRGAFEITETEAIRAIAVCDQYLDSEISRVAQKLEVRFVSGTDEEIPAQYCQEGAFVTEPVLSKAGYTLVGWYTSAEKQDETTKWDFGNDVVNEELTLYAKWSANTYRLNFDLNYEGAAAIDSRDIVFDTAYGTLPTVPSRTGYIFKGWYTEAAGGELITENTIYTIADNSTIYAQWTLNVYTITFDANGGRTDIAEKEVTYSESYGELPVPVLPEAEFLGWYTEAEGGTLVTAETIVEIPEDQTLYAHWEYKTVEMPEASVPTQTEVEPGTRVLLSTRTSGAMIYYTTDKNIGENVTIENGILYEDAIVVNEGMTIYAFAVKEPYKKSPVMTVTYTVRDTSNEWGDVLEKDRQEIEAEVPSQIPEELWMAGVTDCDYAGKAITYPDLRVYHHKTLLSANTDYTVKYKNNTKAGTAAVTINGKGNYTGTIVKTFTIRPLDISEAVAPDITLPYTGKVQKGTTTVTYLLGEKKVTLKKGTDFTYEYPGTNSKEEDYDENAFKSVGNHTVKIIGKGNYQGTTTFTQKIAEESQYVIGKMKLTKIGKQPYTGEEIKPTIRLENGRTPLKEGTHYKVEYDNNIAVGTATVTITGIEGSGYVGTRTTTFQITGTPLSKRKMEGFASSLPWAEEPVKQEKVTFSYTTGMGEEKETHYLVENTDYEVEYRNNEKIGTATVIYKGIGGHTGTIKKTFKITGILMKDVVVNNLEPSLEYDGKEMEQSGYELTYTDKEGQETTLEEGTDYTVSYKNHHKAGTATVTFKGINGYTGTINKTYRINAYDVNGDRIQISEISDRKYTKGGVTPKPVVTYTNKEGQKIILEEGKDYTLKYANHKAQAEKTDKKAPTVTITGKNGFKNKVDVKFNIIGSDLYELDITAKDVVWKNKANICKPVITLTDSNGKKLKAGTDYKKEIKYTYTIGADVTQVGKTETVPRGAGEEVNKKDIIPVGTEITAIVTGINNYSEERPVTFRYVAGDISKVAVKVADQTYTGKAVEPDKNAITVKIGKTVLAKTDYEIVQYSNNVKKGTGKVTIEGRGNYSGQKTVNFKISAKNMNYTIVYEKNGEGVTGTMKNSVISVGKKLTANAYRRAGYTFEGWNTKADGSGTPYDNKEAFYLKDGKTVYGRKVILYAQWKEK